MTEIQSSVMHLLYAHDIWDGFEPHWAEDEVQGWNGEHPSLAHFASTSGKKVVIDIGVWKGQSTITMAQSMKRNHIDGVVIAIDTFLGSHEHWGGTEPPCLAAITAILISTGPSFRTSPVRNSRTTLFPCRRHPQRQCRSWRL